MCKICYSKLEEPGAILLSPPNINSLCEIFHICFRCFKQLLDLFDESYWCWLRTRDNRGHT